MYPQSQHMVSGNVLSKSTSQSSQTTVSAAAEPSFIPINNPEQKVSRKRPRYYEDESSDDDQDEDAGIDPESYYQSTPQKMAKVVDVFIDKTFQRCIPKRKRFEMAREHPKPSSSAVTVPTLDHDIKGALGKELPDKSDFLVP